MIKTNTNAIVNEKMLHEKTSFKFEVADVKTLLPKQINQLKCGDIVCKKTGNEKHAYIVSYKDEVKGEMCLTYCDHERIEEVYYEVRNSAWTYVQTDTTELLEKEIKDLTQTKILDFLGSNQSNIDYAKVNGNPCVCRALKQSGNTIFCSIVYLGYNDMTYAYTTMNSVSQPNYTFDDVENDGDNYFLAVPNYTQDANTGDVLKIGANGKPEWGSLNVGTKLYLHKTNLYGNVSSGYPQLGIITDVSTPITSVDDFKDMLKTHLVKFVIHAVGGPSSGTEDINVISAYPSSLTSWKVDIIQPLTSATIVEKTFTASPFTDNVVTLN